MSSSQRHAFDRLFAAVQTRNTARVWDACGEVKKTLTTSRIVATSEGLRRCAYDALLHCFAAEGAYAAAAATLCDMKNVGAYIDVHTLDMVLAAAVTTGDLMLVEEALCNYEQCKLSQSDTNDEPVAKWTPFTYEHLLRYCRISRNFEFSLIIVHAAQVHNVALNPNALLHFLECATAVGEPRLAFEFAQQGPNCDVVHWIVVLRGAAEYNYAPALTESWHNAIRGGLVPDEGLCLHILATCARSGAYELAEEVIQSMVKNFGHECLREWHLTPLFSSHCTGLHFSGAARVLEMMKHHNISPGRAIVQLASTAAHDRESLDAAITAVLSADVPIKALNELIYAAAELKALDAANRVFVAALGTDIQRETCNAMLQACISAQCIESAIKTWSVLHDRNIAPDAQTFERMIRLYLNGCNYETAFELLETCKEHGLVPTRRTYAAMIWTCWRREDARWEALLQEMHEAGYELVDSVRQSLGLDKEAAMD